MPELPEVETTLNGIKPHLIDRQIVRAIVRQPQLRQTINPDLNTLLSQQKIIALSRRAKYLLIHLQRGTILIHLGMSGHLKIVAQDSPIKKHDHVDLILDDQQCLRFNDPRRFGLFLYINSDLEQYRLFKKLGPEPLSEAFDAEYLFKSCHNRSASIKSLIMNNDIVVGVGNIYASESLFLAYIHPAKPGKELSLQECTSLVMHIKNILNKAIQQGGTTLRDFYGADGKPGYFALSLAVYGRHKQNCYTCNHMIESMIIGGRASAYCPDCQKF